MERDEKNPLYHFKSIMLIFHLWEFSFILIFRGSYSPTKRIALVAVYIRNRIERQTQRGYRRAQEYKSM